MKKYIFLGCFLAAPLLSVASDNPFEESFTGMFQPMDHIPVYIPESGPPPPVPLDGGLVALLIAGGAAGYSRYKKKRNEN